MTTPGRFILNDQVVDALVAGPFESMLRGNYIYESVNTSAHEPLHLELHMRYAGASYEKLYGVSPDWDSARMRLLIKKLLHAERMPRLGNIVTIYLLPPELPATRPDILVTAGQSTIYKGYELVSIRSKALLANYEMPFAGHRTAVSSATSTYMKRFAAERGCHITLRCNRAGQLVSCGDYPVFVAKDGAVYTPGSNTFPKCAERELMDEASRLAAVQIQESDIQADMLSEADEIMVFDHTGIHSVLSLGRCYYYNLMAQRIGAMLAAVTTQGLHNE